MSNSSQARQPEQIDKPAGSLDNGEPVFLVVGKLRKPHGLPRGIAHGSAHRLP